MRIGIDFRVAVPQPTGVERYILNLTRSLLQVDWENQYVLFGEPALIGALLPAYPRLEVVPVAAESQLQEFRWEHLGIPYAVWQYRLDLFHRPNDVGAPCFDLGVPLVVTAHDLIPLIYPDTYLQGPLHALYYRTRLALMRRRAARVITDSEHSRHDLEKLGRIAAERIRVIAPGVDDAFMGEWTTEGRERAHLAKYGLADRAYVLTMGANEERKNVITVIKAFQQVLNQGDSLHLLAVLGKLHGPSRNDLEKAVWDAGLAERVVFLGYVADADIPLLYRRADCFVYLSLYEGFGLPVLEAMSCGAPVLAANATALPEVVGDAGVLVDPQDVAAVAQAMGQLLRDRGLRQGLITRGRQRARLFSYRDTARRTLDVYREVVSQATKVTSPE